MFVKYNEGQQNIPIRIWLENQEAIEEKCMEQAMNLARLPFLHKWVALMPDTHTGVGMPIGGVIAAKGVIIPNAVGRDIGCGMAYVKTSLEAKLLRDTQTPSGSLLQVIIGDILRNIPLGFNRHKVPQPCRTIDEALLNPEQYRFAEALMPEIESGYIQIVTLGGGNHFIELQEDEEGKVSIMLHSGSRHLGNKICEYFHGIAQAENQRWHAGVPEGYHLAFLPVDSPPGQAYIHWMNLALDFAQENRARMMTTVQGILEKWVHKAELGPIAYEEIVNCHHNYAALEHHYGQNVWVHRKGAIRAREGDIGIIPGAMGSYSYIVEGKGNPESFHSCSHGAGRRLSRTKARESITVEEVMLDLKESGVVLGKNNKQDVAEEARMSYKDIDTVISNELDLITPIRRLKTMGVIKG